MFCSSCGAELPSAPPVSCPACGTDHWANAKPCAGALVTEGGKVLLVRRAHEPWLGLWDIPGGFCELTEHPIEAAVREVKEESGLDARVTGFVGIWMDTYGRPGPGLPEVVTLNIYYHADLAGPNEPHPDPVEVSEVGWFAPGQLPTPQNTAFPRQQVPVLEAWRQSMVKGLPRSTDLIDRP